jgi:endonuclease YncB( thermonuclease family)
MGNRTSSRAVKIAEPELDMLPDNIQWNRTIPFIVPLTKGKVIKVYDGDTITIAAKLPQMSNDSIYRFSIRIRGIDAPELNGKTDDEKDMAIKARDALHKLIYNKYVSLDNLSHEKYSRLLADVYCNGISVGDWLLNKRYAVAYDGITKKTPQNWTKFFETGELGTDLVDVNATEPQNTTPTSENTKQTSENTVKDVPQDSQGVEKNECPSTNTQSEQIEKCIDEIEIVVGPVATMDSNVEMQGTEVILIEIPLEIIDQGNQICGQNI